MPIAEAKRRGNDKYNQKCDYISIRPLKPIGEKIRKAAKESGKSLQGYILDAVDKQIGFDETGRNELDADIIPNLMKWLEKHGHTPDEIIDCISYLSNE